MTFVTIGSNTLGLLTIVGQVLAIGILVGLLVRKKEVIDFFSKYALLFSFVVALVATLGSLFYSEIAGYEPCKLCWFQRILMYPQVLLLGMAWWRKERLMLGYASTLSMIGGLVAGYHYLLQRGIAPALPCSAVGASVACSKVFVMQYGYITIPLMAFTAFVLIFLFTWAGIKKDCEKAA